MRVLLTGARGQVGGTLLESAPGGSSVLGLSHADLDIADGEAVRACVAEHRADVIINAAAYTAVDKAQSQPDLARRVNAEGPRHLAAAARDCGARLIHISTDFVFDGTASAPYRPHAPTNPLSVYGRTKRDGELAVLDELPDRSTIVRTAWVYGAAGANFVRTMLRILGSQGSVRVVADQVGTPTAARSLAEVLWRIAARPDIRGIHHWTDAGVASWYDFAVAIAEEGAIVGLVPPTAAVIPIATEEYPTPAQRPAYSVLDKRSLVSLGFEPLHWRVRLRSVLKEMAGA